MISCRPATLVRKSSAPGETAVAAPRRASPLVRAADPHGASLSVLFPVPARRPQSTSGGRIPSWPGYGAIAAPLAAAPFGGCDYRSDMQIRRAAHQVGTWGRWRPRMCTPGCGGWLLG